MYFLKWINKGLIINIIVFCKSRDIKSQINTFNVTSASIIHPITARIKQIIGLINVFFCAVKVKFNGRDVRV